MLVEIKHNKLIVWNPRNFVGFLKARIIFFLDLVEHSMSICGENRSFGDKFLQETESCEELK